MLLKFQPFKQTKRKKKWWDESGWNLPPWNFVSKSTVAVGEWGIGLAVVALHRLATRLLYSWNTFEMAVGMEVVAVDFAQLRRD